MLVGRLRARLRFSRTWVMRFGLLAGLSLAVGVLELLDVADCCVLARPPLPTWDGEVGSRLTIRRRVGALMAAAAAMVVAGCSCNADDSWGCAAPYP